MEADGSIERYSPSISRIIQTDSQQIYLLACGTDSKLRVYDAVNGKLLVTSDDSHDHYVHKVLLTQSLIDPRFRSSRFLTYGDSRILRMFEVTTLSLLACYKFDTSVSFEKRIHSLAQPV